MALEGDYAKRLEEWLTVNKQQWEQLQGFGVEAGAELELDYSFSAPGEAEARKFSEVLNGELQYESAATLLPADDQGNPEVWVVHGTTAPTKSDPDLLDQWVTTLITLGAAHRCMFEGWGAYPPNMKPQLSFGLGGYQNDPETEAKFPKLIHVTIPEAIEPIDRGEKYEDPLAAMLTEGGIGAIVRAGSLIDFTDEGVKIKGIEFVIRTADQAGTSEAVRSFLSSCGAPTGMEIKPIEKDALG